MRERPRVSTARLRGRNQIALCREQIIVAAGNRAAAQAHAPQCRDREANGEIHGNMLGDSVARQHSSQNDAHRPALTGRWAMRLTPLALEVFNIGSIP